MWIHHINCVNSRNIHGTIVMLLLLLLEMHKVVGVFLAVDWMYISQVIDELGSVDDVIKLLNHQASNSSTLYADEQSDCQR